jgi:glycosyltransferase involved in cell wall biosynthesis
VGGAALFLSWARRTPLIFEVRDLWPESAVELGELTNPRAIAWATRLENACYQRARLIVVVTQGILERLRGRGIHPGKLYLAPNGANVEMFHFDETARARLRQELGLQDPFIAIYAGIHGIAQGLETVIEAAKLLKENPGIHFLLVGDGPKKAELVELAQRYQLPNLTFISEQPRQAMIAYLSAADVALIPLRNLELFKGALPSKIFDAWACELPVLINFEGEAREIVEEAQAGIGIPPEDPQALADALRRLQPAREERREMGKRGRQFTIERYSRQTQARRLAEKLEDILHNSFKDGT